MKSHIRFSLVATVATICVASLAVHAWTSPPNQAGSDRSERIVPALPSQASRPHNIVVRIDAVTLVEQTESTKLLKLDVARYYGKITTDSLNRARKHESSQFSILFPAALDADIRPGDLLNYWLVGYTPMRDGNVADNRGVAP